MGPIPNIDSLNVRAIRNVLDELVEYDSTSLRASPTQGVSPWFSVPPWHGKYVDYYAAKDRDEHIIDLCHLLRKGVEDPDNHLVNIDAFLSSRLICRVYIRGVQKGISEDRIAASTYGLLKRLPYTPPELIGSPGDLDKGYFWDDEHVGGGTENGFAGRGTWDSLQVATMLDANTVKMALYIVGSGLNAFANSMQDYPDLLAELLETCSGLTAQCTSDSQSGQWYIVRAALWSSWQRSILLYHYASMRDALEKGWTGMGHMRFRLRSTTPMPGLSIQEMSSRYSGLGKARSMCSWAFELLRTEPACIGMDFRTFHRRYLQLWSKASARCKKDSPLPCAGKDPDGCWRFKGMVIKDQSAHDDTCSKECRKLPWDEASYREASGARAVIIIPEESTAEELRLRYCTASVRTLAISHVWSHGQGGRPHEGVNSCLHRRYVNIGQHLGCDSYWWDSSCIPEDHVLRSEAIQGINQTFSSAKVILVCDKDLMRISISDLTLEIEESILATVLVCDWNLRAWTFLESIRGRHQIHLLCKDNKIISFRKVVQDIFRYGSLDLVIFGLTVSHMLPGSIQIRSLKGAGPLVYAGIKLDNRDTPPEYLIREEGGEILSYRPASRTGDDIVFWSLLVNEDKCDSPEEFWRSKLGEFIHTGFLMSSAPRLNIKSLSWAPSTPYFKPLADNPAAQLLSFRAFSGRETLPGKIIEKGLLADWLVYEFESRSIITHGDQHAIQSRQMVVLRTIHNLYLPQSKWGALLLPLSNVRTFERGGDISTKYRGLVRGTLVAVLASDSVLKPSQQAAEERGWRWKGTFEWNDGIELPAFTEQSEFLIE